MFENVDDTNELSFSHKCKNNAAKKDTPKKLYTNIVMKLEKLRYNVTKYTCLEPNWSPLFRLEFRPCFGGLTFKNRGHWGSRCIYIDRNL